VAVSVLAVQYGTDRVLLATLIAFGPRWLLVVPVIPLAVAALVFTPTRQVPLLVAVLGITIFILVFGALDFRFGGGRARGAPSFRFMTQNLGGSPVTARQLHQFLTTHRIDIAAIQECPFYDDGPKRLGWQFFYGGDLCVISRYPFAVLDVADPGQLWRGGRVPLRLDVDSPAGRFQLLIVHFETVRGGLNALRDFGPNGIESFDRNRLDARTESAAARARLHSSRPFIIAGDFNLPVESAIYKQYWGDLRNLFSRCGRGFGQTKFTPLYGIRIDHVVASNEWECTDAQVLSSPYDGDHRAVVVDVQLQRLTAGGLRVATWQAAADRDTR